MKKITVLSLLLLVNTLKAQNELLSLLGDQEVNQEVYGTFKGTKVINGQSVEMPTKSALFFIIEHRFGTINSGAYELWGLDQASMRMSFEYGVREGVVLGVARNTFQKTYETSIKTRLLRQKEGVGSHVSVATYHAAFINSMRHID